MKRLQLESGSHIHFVGICGTAMGNVAIGLKKRGFTVTGSDKGVYPPMSEVLEGNGIRVLPFGLDNTRDPDFFVIGNAIPRGNVEVEEILNRRKAFCSLPEILRDVFVEGRRLVMITGTHGKTTTTALVYHILKENDLNPAVMMGGVPQGLKSGFEWSTKSELFVMEGDEYDTAFFDKTSKFLKFSPDILVINAIEFDHADIFDSVADIEKAFRFLLRRTPGNAKVLANGDDARALALKSDCYSKFASFGFGEKNPYRIVSVTYGDGRMKVELDMDGEHISLISGMPGKHNAMNIAGACSVCRELGVSATGLEQAIATFPGVRRRFEERAFNEVTGGRVIEDFAHHPTAVSATIRGAREIFPGKRIVAFFEPASNTMRRGELRSELLTALNMADIAFLLPVPQGRRELAQNTPEIPVGSLAERVVGLNKQNEIENIFREQVYPGDVILILSNGTGQGSLEKAIDFVNGGKHE